jgi:hypothetical protein
MSQSISSGLKKCDSFCGYVEIFSLDSTQIRLSIILTGSLRLLEDGHRVSGQMDMARFCDGLTHGN